MRSFWRCSARPVSDVLLRIEMLDNGELGAEYTAMAVHSGCFEKGSGSSAELAMRSLGDEIEKRSSAMKLSAAKLMDETAYLDEVLSSIRQGAYDRPEFIKCAGGFGYAIVDTGVPGMSADEL